MTQINIRGFIVSILYCVVCTFGDELVQVHLIFRHGDRSPIFTYPNNPVNNTAWLQGYGQLSQRGMMQQYELGKFLRRRYIEGFPYKFINETYLRSEVEVRSTDWDRTLMSVYSNLAGLFPPAGAQIWNKNLTWQPIPVHTVPAETDVTLVIDNDCPTFNKIFKPISESDEVKQYEESIKPFLNVVYKDAGLVGSEARIHVKGIADALFCQEQFGYPVPEWALKKWGNGTVYDKLKEIRERDFNLYLNRPELSRFKGGPFVGMILQNMTDRVKGNPTKKFFMYSSVSATLSDLLLTLFAPAVYKFSIMATMSVYNRIIPPYASCLIFELIRSSSGQHFVRLLYRNDSSTEPNLISFPVYGNNCTLDQFINLTKPSVPLDYDKECNPGLHINTVEAVMGAALAISFIVILILCCCIVKRRKHTSSEGNLYMKLHNVIDD